MEPTFVNWVGISKLIENAKVSSSVGVDGISYRFLKSTMAHSSLIFSGSFTQSWQCTTLPDEWKARKVLPVYISGNICNPSNYKSFFHHTLIYKILEHVI